jgi:hypothetical protein
MLGFLNPQTRRPSKIFDGDVDVATRRRRGGKLQPLEGVARAKNAGHARQGYDQCLSFIFVGFDILMVASAVFARSVPSCDGPLPHGTLDLGCIFSQS